jgi:hypothetical protein
MNRRPSSPSSPQPQLGFAAGSPPLPDLERTELDQASVNRDDDIISYPDHRKLMDILSEFNEDWGDDEGVELICGLENPDICESCQ